MTGRTKIGIQMNRVVITGMGWITPMGHSIEAVWQRLLRGESGIARTSLFDASTFRHLTALGLGPGWRVWEVGAGGEAE